MSEGGRDCDDTQVSINPFNTDIHGDGIDQNCDGIADDGFEDTDGDFIANCVDEDDDQDGDPDVSDCQPLNALIGSTVMELCDAVDNDCDDAIDEIFSDDDQNGILDCVTGDLDGDGDPDGVDCAPYDSAIGHGLPDVCNGVDDDCDGVFDEDFITGGTVTYTTTDGQSGKVKDDACGTGGW